MKHVATSVSCRTRARGGGDPIADFALASEYKHQLANSHEFRLRFCTTPQLGRAKFSKLLQQLLKLLLLSQNWPEWLTFGSFLYKKGDILFGIG